MVTEVFCHLWSDGFRNRGHSRLIIVFARAPLLFTNRVDLRTTGRPARRDCAYPRVRGRPPMGRPQRHPSRDLPDSRRRLNLLLVGDAQPLLQLPPPPPPMAGFDADESSSPLPVDDGAAPVILAKDYAPGGFPQTTIELDETTDDLFSGRLQCWWYDASRNH